jgi:hypothetical protein
MSSPVRLLGLLFLGVGIGMLSVIPSLTAGMDLAYPVVTHSH